MRRSREDKAETHHRIVDAAARLFRERGIGAVSVADVMDAVGMTVGGFYRHFASKDELVAAAIDSASIASMRAGADTYLSMAHRNHPGNGCPVAALCSEVGHEGAHTKKAFTIALERMLERIAEAIPGESRAARDRRLQTAASLVGAVALARATNDTTLAKDLLDAVRRGIKPRK